MNRSRIINYIALLVLLAATATSLYWIWGLLLAWWVVPIVMNGKAFLVFEINRSEDPFLFWTIVVLWGVLGLMMIGASLFPQYAHFLA